MEAYLYQEMFELERTHWWFAAKHRIVLEVLRRFAPPESAGAARRQIADIGCGCGRMLELMANSYDAVGMDASPIAVEFSRQRGVKVVEGKLPDPLGLPEHSFDAVTMLDVLEHLDDDVACARSVARLLKPQGILLLTVPAHQWLFGPHDTAHHHRRRYSRWQLRQVLQQAGLHVRFVTYCNTILFPLALAQRAAALLASGNQAPATVIPAKPINALFRSIFSAERHLIGRVPMPWGLSLLAVATPDEAPATPIGG